ncbi:MAG: hypothetical protein JO336_00130, partial [Acidobacteriia bacterium]|nr:hypothetical protein [Terriglobia bacterium]
SDLRGKTLYFLNVSEMPTTINFCEVKQPKQYACVAERRHVSSYNLGARQSMLFDLENFRQKYLMIESLPAVKAVIVGLADGPGQARVFSTKSTITFGQR